MKIFKSILEFIKSIFTKKEEIKQIEPPKETINITRENFINSIKTKNNKPTTGVETLICEGDGLGIQPKITG
ncbi:MAG: hypothetical protein IKP28_06690 [Clostridia bacterium]|nr:hypothetical protein [Clostridia bacterium]